MGFIFSKIFNNLVGQQEMRILILGLDNSGKTTILYKLHLNEVIQTAPSIIISEQPWDSTSKLSPIRTLNFKCGIQEDRMPLGEHVCNFRLYWRSYYPSTNGVIYVIDSFDKNRMQTSKQELMTLLSEEELQGVPLLVLANKQDMQGALSEGEIAEFMDLHELKNRQWTIVKCSAMTGLGLNEGMEWMANTIKK